eukprot:CAMPEP_0195249600 /NCGR_PEP_ID=MMETSP0706-20130129/2214_1 /TAXON_ID=33640 /ORGANISM="Asterionellopsis glacialis, Strain CCMP134" /LENGTH=175 /DNA_ID=CAMNT_0040301437 /DNA_START=80 /DNA_END=610 /DNA_ORIENTATION=+
MNKAEKPNASYQSVEVRQGDDDDVASAEWSESQRSLMKMSKGFSIFLVLLFAVSKLTTGMSGNHGTMPTISSLPELGDATAFKAGEPVCYISDDGEVTDGDGEVLGYCSDGFVKDLDGNKLGYYLHTAVFDMQNNNKGYLGRGGYLYDDKGMMAGRVDGYTMQMGEAAAALIYLC